VATGTGNNTMYDLKFSFSVGSYICTSLHVIAFEKTVILIFFALGTFNLTE
jgi:hypothetical protein